MIRLGHFAKKGIAKISSPKSIHIFGMGVKADANFNKLTPAERIKVEKMRKIRGNMVFLKLPNKKQQQTADKTLDEKEDN